MTVRAEIPVTARKLLSLEPAWREFRGSSVIFRPMGTRIYDPAGADAAAVDRWRHDLETIAHWGRPFGFCPLPIDTHHMTLADLVHDGILARIARSVDLGGIDPEDLVRTEPPYPERVKEVVIASGIVRDEPSVTLLTAEIEVRHSALVVALDLPLGREAVRRLELYLEPRRRLTRLFADAFAFEVQPLRPHITLGYFANLDVAHAAADALDELEDRLGTGFRGRKCVFTGVRVHLFTDMVTFWPIELA